MGDEYQNGPRFVPQIEKMVLELDACEGVKGREWLVQQQHGRPGYQSPGYGNALSLAARELPRPHSWLVGEAYALDGEGNALAPPGPRAALEAEADIVCHPQPGQQPWLLEEDTDALVRRCDGYAVEQNPALRRRIEAARGAQKGGFAAARAADDDEQLSCSDLQRQVFQCAHAVGIRFRDPIKDEHRCILSGARRHLPNAGRAQQRWR